MAIAVTCGSCQASIRVKEEHAGKTGKCPRCRATVEIPRPMEPFEVPTVREERSTGEPLDLRAILQSFSGSISPVRTTAFYRVGIVILTVAMLVLPLLYLALIAGIAWLLVYHATENVAGIGRLRSVVGFIFLYLGPLIVGAILLFFMVKPLFARRSRTRKLRTLEFGAEPLLFSLVSRIAKAVGSPEPKRIDVDCQVNASASFGGTFGVVLGGDLVLTLGLPLVAGMSVQQLAGVIAHELGHLAQGTGMRLSYLVRSINAWFARTVYERDDWDEALVRGCEREDRLAIFLLLAMLCIWLTRCILWVFMFAGHAMSCFMLRQMEYDADRCETRLAGTRAFAETTRRLMELSIAMNRAHELAAKSWTQGGPLPNDLCALMEAVADSLSPKETRTIEELMEKQTTGFFDTHPAAKDRIASARQENTEGVFSLEGAAKPLFAEFRKTSKAVTFDFYREILGKQVKRERLAPVSAFLDATRDVRFD